MHSRRLISLILTVLFLFAASTATAADKPENRRKQTQLGLYLTAAEAYTLWRGDKDHILVIDCRTPEEYAFVGHATMAVNIPGWFVSHRLNVRSKSYVMVENEAFVPLVQARSKPDGAILVMCRSGARSAACVNRLAAAGFSRVYTIVDGFEGATDEKPGSPTFGQRVIDGWRNSNLPWTYEIDPAQAYQEP